MSNTVKQSNENNLIALYEELERRYGLVLAQQIIDEIRKSENLAYIPEYMPVKVLSEVVDVLRPEAKNALKRLKSVKASLCILPKGVEHFEIKRLEKDFERLFVCYRLAQTVFYDFYRRAMKQAIAPTYIPGHVYRDLPTNPEMARLPRPYKKAV